MANEAFRANTAQELIKMYNLDALVADRQKAKATTEKIKTLEETSNSLKDFAEEVEKQIEDLEKIADGKITTYYYSGVPTLSNFPANEWTIEEYENHIGDMYYDKDTGYAYKFLFDNETNEYLWRKETNPELSEALAKANNALEIANGAKNTAENAQSTANSASSKAENAQDTADKAQTTANSKMQIFVDTPYPPYQIGDLWLKDDKVIYRCRAEKESGSYDENDWKLGTDFTNDDYAKNVEEQLKAYKEVVSTDYVLKATFEENNEGFEQRVQSTTTKISEVEATVIDNNENLTKQIENLASKTEVEEVVKSVTQLQTDSYTKTEIKKIINGTYFDEQGNPITVTKLQTNSSLFDEDGMHYAKSEAPTSSTINEKGVAVEDATGTTKSDLLYAGYVDQEKISTNQKLKEFEGQTVVYTKNAVVDNYFVMGNYSRTEDYEEEVEQDDGTTVVKKGTGVFYMGG